MSTTGDSARGTPKHDARMHLPRVRRERHVHATGQCFHACAQAEGLALVLEWRMEEKAYVAWEGVILASHCPRGAARHAPVRV